MNLRNRLESRLDTFLLRLRNRSDTIARVLVMLATVALATAIVVIAT